MHRARIERAVVRLRAVTSRSRNATLRMQLVEHYNAQPPSGGGAEHIPSSDPLAPSPFLAALSARASPCKRLGAAIPRAPNSAPLCAARLSRRLGRALPPWVPGGPSSNMAGRVALAGIGLPHRPAFASDRYSSIPVVEACRIHNDNVCPTEVVWLIRLGNSAKDPSSWAEF